MKNTSLRLPIAGFAKRVDDSVARAMAILRNREDFTAREPASTLPPPARKARQWNLDT